MHRIVLFSLIVLLICQKNIHSRIIHEDILQFYALLLVRQNSFHNFSYFTSFISQ